MLGISLELLRSSWPQAVMRWLVHRNVLFALIFVSVALAAGLLFGPAGFQDRLRAAVPNTISSPDSSVVGAYPSLELDASGNPVVAYFDETNRDLKLLHCNDAACLGGDESITAPDTVGDVGWYVSMSLDAAGNPVLSYYDSTNLRLKIMHCNDPNCAGGDESVTMPDSEPYMGVSTALVLDASGNPVVTYASGTGASPPRLMHCNDSNCSGGDETFGRGLGTSQMAAELVLDSSGFPVLLIGSRILRCNDADCTGDDETITNLVQVLGYTFVPSSIALDAADNPVIANYASSASPIRGLTILHCHDPICEDYNAFYPDDLEGPVRYMSMALNAAGHPIVAYRDAAQQLKILYCNDPDCAGDDDTLVIPGPDVGLLEYVSMRRDATGIPVISYQNGGNGQLTILACGTTDCDPFKLPPSTFTPTFTVTPTDTATPTATPTKMPDPGDTDGDGCSDQRENGPDETLGGQRDYKNRWDFYDVLGFNGGPPDQVIDLPNDILGVIQHYSPLGQPPYDVQFDRGPSAGPNAWNMTAPDGVIDLPNDILGVILQHGHSCV